MNLLQIATGITKCDHYYKLRQALQSATIITNCDRHYKVRPLLQIATVQMSYERKLGWALSMNNQQRKLTFVSYSTTKPVTVILSSTSIMYEKTIINFSQRYCVPTSAIHRFE